MGMSKEETERVEEFKAKNPRSDRYVTAYLGDADLKILAGLQAELGCSRSAVVRSALHAYAGVVAAIVK